MDELPIPEEQEAAHQMEEKSLQGRIYEKTRELGLTPAKLFSGTGEIADLNLEDGPDVWERVKRPFVVLECAHPDSDVRSVIYKARTEPDPRNSQSLEQRFYEGFVRSHGEKLSSLGIELPRIIGGDATANPPFILISYLDGKPAGSIHMSAEDQLEEEDLPKVFQFVEEVEQYYSREGRTEEIPKLNCAEQYRKVLADVESNPQFFDQATIKKLRELLATAEILIEGLAYRYSARDLNPSNLIKDKSRNTLGFIDFERNTLANNPGRNFSFLAVSLWNRPELQQRLIDEVGERKGDDTKRLTMIDLALFRLPGEIMHWEKIRRENVQLDPPDLAEKALISHQEMLQSILEELGGGK